MPAHRQWTSAAVVETVSARLRRHVPRLRGYLARLPPWRQRAQALAFLAPAVLLAVFLGRGERPALVTVTSNLVERMLLPAGILFVLSVLVVLAGPWPLARVGALVGGGLSVAVGLACCLAVGTPVDWWGGFVVSVLTVVGGVGLIVLCAGGTAPRLQLRGRQLAVAATALLALLPLVQFWHTASFVPSRLTTALGATVDTRAVATKDGARGTVEVTITNRGDVGAVILASKLQVCHRRGIGAPAGGAGCVTEPVLSDLTRIDADSTWRYQRAIRRPRDAPAKVRLLEVVVTLWYARQDRVSLGEQIPDLAREGDLAACGGQATVRGYPVLYDSRLQDVVREPRRLVYVQRDKKLKFGFQQRDDQVCTDDGRPLVSPPIDRSVGWQSMWVTHEAWVDPPRR
jgi:hypothetical protein